MRPGGRRGTAGRARALPAMLLALLLGSAAAGGSRAADEAGPADAVPLGQVMPGALRFGAFEGDPPAAPAYRGDELVGYVFFTQQVVSSVGYSGKRLNVLVGLGLDGRITGAEIVEQHEPILIIGVSEEGLHAFVRQYEGLDVRQPIQVTRAQRDGGAVDAVSGATISSTVINDAILRAARAVAASRGIFGAEAARLDLASFEPVDWQTLLAEGSLQRLALTVGDVEETLAARGARAADAGGAAPAPGATFVELYVGLATPARIGRNLLGDRLYNRAAAELAEGAQLVFVGGRGLYSFTGTTWRRSGVFDRLQIAQGERTFTLTEERHRRLDALAIEGAPELRELALFTLPAGSGFAPDQPWRVELLVAGRDSVGEEVYASFGATYRLPARYVREPVAVPGDTAGPARPLWERVWRDRPIDIAILGAALLTLTGILVFQDTIARRRRLWFWLRAGFLSFTLLWLGWYAAAQLSVLNVLTFAEALRTEFHWEFFLLDPLLFILWSYVAVALLFWGRGVFCGWLCPFGALQELSNKAARRLGLPQYRVPFAVHERVWPIKYVVFLALFALSLGPMALAITLAEVEPFKTAIVLRFDRAWPFVVYALALLGIGLFVERAFCRYLCPLGAALAIPAKLRLFEWLKRHRQCGAPCQICAVDCPVQAIHPDGRINPNECIHCLTCQVNYHDSYVCPPMIERRTRREKRAAIIGKARRDGGPARAAPAGEETAT
ncbi:MAG TPA: 4Fe-4S binding protein [Geminicoccaceae bacterium]|nr:4Fe-4S binding protein [Geminicoccaceae bacterium]